MNRYRSTAMNHNHHHNRLIDNNLRHEEEGVYFLNGLELKRPNIISRRNHNHNSCNNKFQVIQVHQSPSSSLIHHQHHPIGNGIFNIETFTGDEPGSWTSVTEDSVVPIELLSSNSFIVPDSTFPSSSVEISLALEPSVVAQPIILPELPLTYDSTCVSQAISTPIVTPIVSGGSLASDYVTVTNSSQPAFEIELSGGNPGDDDPLQMLQDDNEVYLSSIPGGDDEIMSSGHLDHHQVLPPPNLNQMRIETQADGSLVLYLEGGGSGEDPIDLGSDTQIIQTDAFPVRPNVPFELPSQGDDGLTESFILVPIDDQGNTVLVPTSKTRVSNTTRRLKSKDPLTSYGSPLYLKEKMEVGGEKPKPFRYDFPDEVEESPPYPYQDGMFSTLVPQLLMDPPEEKSKMAEPPPVRLMQNINSRKRVAPTTPSSQIGKETTKVTKSILPNLSCQSDEDDGIVEMAMGTFKCKYCPKETRLKVGILNHIRRIHKSKSGQDKVPVPLPDPDVQIQDTNTGADDQFAFRDEDEMPTFTLISASSTLLNTSLNLIANSPPPSLEKEVETQQILSPVARPQESPGNDPSSSPTANNKDLTTPPEKDEEISAPSEPKTLKRKPIQVIPNGKFRKVTVEPILNKSEPVSSPSSHGRTSPRKYPPSKVNVEPVKPTDILNSKITTVRTMKTRSSATSGRCLRNSRYL